MSVYGFMLRTLFLDQHVWMSITKNNKWYIMYQTWILLSKKTVICSNILTNIYKIKFACPNIIYQCCNKINIPRCPICIHFYILFGNTCFNTNIQQILFRSFDFALLKKPLPRLNTHCSNYYKVIISRTILVILVPLNTNNCQSMLLSEIH